MTTTEPLITAAPAIAGPDGPAGGDVEIVVPVYNEEAGLEAAAAEVADVTVFGTLWVAQSVIFDRVLFRQSTGAPVALPSSERELRAA